MEIKRDKYLNDLIDRMHNGMIKVITGIRRSGKSFLVFHIFRNYLLKNGVKESHIIAIEPDQRKNRQYRDPDAILDHIEALITDREKYYILLDEVHVYPLTFKEFMQVYDKDEYHGWADYIIYGGLPLTVTMKTEEQKINYLSRLFEETYIRDIRERNHIEKVQELSDLINVLASGIGSLSNPTRIRATFQNEIRSDISLNTIRQYIEYLEDAFIIQEANRYDVKGKKYIGTPLKYYFEDVGLRNARLGFRQIEETPLMENVIYNELRARGFQVDVGVVSKRSVNEMGKHENKQLEIDFVANLGSRRYYIQSVLNIADEEKRRQEKASLVAVPDSFKKIIVVKDVIRVRHDEDGILTMSIYDFLLRENSLEL